MREGAHALRPSALAEKGACSAGVSGAVIAVDIAAAKAVGVTRPVRETEEVALDDARGRVIARGLDARMDLPRFDSSAMDGYAVRIASLEGAGPWTLSMGGRIVAGGSFAGASPDQAIRIFTGAEVPAGFDAVVMQERCERVGGSVLIRERPRLDENIRRAGEDVGAGTTMLQAGDEATPQRLALLAGQGYARVPVVRKIRVALVSTGSELREPGEPIGSGQIYNTNRTMLRAMLGAFAWAEVVDYGIVADEPGALSRVFGEAARSCDVVVTTGGVSAGEEDHVVGALNRNGGTLDVLKVAMRPGKPVKVGLLGGLPFIGLPGNPNAALVTFRQIALPAIRTVAGLARVAPTWFAAVSGFSYEKRLGRTEFVPVRVDGRDEFGRPVLSMLGRGSSASLMAMAQADGIALLPPEIGSIGSGLPILFEPFAI